MVGFAYSTIWSYRKKCFRFKNTCGKTQDGDPSANSVKGGEKALMVKVKLHGFE